MGQVGGACCYGTATTVTCAGDDTLLAQAWNSIGDYYAERQRYRHAVTYYSQGRNYQQLAECYYRLEDFVALKDIVGTLPPNSPLLEVCIKVVAERRDIRG